jgi:peptide/nickel transport system substrate-binding protein
MLERMYDSATYNVLYYEPDLQAYRTDRFEGWVRQPADTGPVMFSNSSPSYAALTPLASASDGGGGVGTGAIVGIAIAAVALIGGAIVLLSRRRSADERE